MSKYKNLNKEGECGQYLVAYVLKSVHYTKGIKKIVSSEIVHELATLNLVFMTELSRKP